MSDPFARHFGGKMDSVSSYGDSESEASVSPRRDRGKRHSPDRGGKSRGHIPAHKGAKSEVTTTDSLMETETTEQSSESRAPRRYGGREPSPSESSAVYSAAYPQSELSSVPRRGKERKGHKTHGDKRRRTSRVRRGLPVVDSRSRRTRDVTSAVGGSSFVTEDTWETESTVSKRVDEDVFGGDGGLGSVEEGFSIDTHPDGMDGVSGDIEAGRSRAIPAPPLPGIARDAVAVGAASKIIAPLEGDDDQSSIDARGGGLFGERTKHAAKMAAKQRLHRPDLAADVLTLDYTPVTAPLPSEMRVPLRHRRSGRVVRLVLGITGYNEDGDELRYTLEGIAKNLKHIYRMHGIPPEEILVVVILDGMDKASETMLAYCRKLGIYDDDLIIAEVYPTEGEAGTLDGTGEGRNPRSYVVGVEGVGGGAGEFGEERAEEKHVGRSVTMHIFERTVPIPVDEGGKTHYPPLPMLLGVKAKNGGKLSSHLWLFEGVARQVHPQYVSTIDVGTAPQERSVARLVDLLERSPNVGGCCGQILPRMARWWSPLEGAQYFEYKTSHQLLKSAEAAVGFITVLPGAFSMFRWEAIRGVPIERYFILEATSAGDMDPVTANMFLAEDRILCFEIVAQQDHAWILSFDPAAIAETDVPESLAELTRQRRRWANGSFGAMLWTLASTERLLQARHSLLRKFFFILQACYNGFIVLVNWFQPAAFFLAFLVILGNALDRRFIPIVVKVGLQFACTCLYMLLFIVQLVLSLAGDISHLKQSYNTISWIWSGVMILTVILAATVAFEVDNEDTVLATLIIITLIAAFGVYFLGALAHLEIFRTFLWSPHYLLLLPSMANMIATYSISNLNSTSWGTKGANSNALVIMNRRQEAALAREDARRLGHAIRDLALTTRRHLMESGVGSTDASSRFASETSAASSAALSYLESSGYISASTAQETSAASSDYSSAASSSISRPSRHRGDGSEASRWQRSHPHPHKYVEEEEEEDDEDEEGSYYSEYDEGEDGDEREDEGKGTGALGLRVRPKPESRLHERAPLLRVDVRRHSGSTTKSNVAKTVKAAGEVSGYTDATASVLVGGDGEGKGPSTDPSTSTDEEETRDAVGPLLGAGGGAGAAAPAHRPPPHRGSKSRTKGGGKRLGSTSSASSSVRSRPKRGSASSGASSGSKASSYSKSDRDRYLDEVNSILSEDFDDPRRRGPKRGATAGPPPPPGAIQPPRRGKVGRSTKRKSVYVGFDAKDKHAEQQEKGRMRLNAGTKTGPIIEAPLYILAEGSTAGSSVVSAGAPRALDAPPLSSVDEYDDDYVSAGGFSLSQSVVPGLAKARRESAVHRALRATSTTQPSSSSSAVFRSSHEASVGASVAALTTSAAGSGASQEHSKYRDDVEGYIAAIRQAERARQERIRAAEEAERLANSKEFDPKKLAIRFNAFRLRMVILWVLSNLFMIIFVVYFDGLYIFIFSLSGTIVLAGGLQVLGSFFFQFSRLFSWCFQRGCYPGCYRADTRFAQPKWRCCCRPETFFDNDVEWAEDVRYVRPIREGTGLLVEFKDELAEAEAARLAADDAQSATSGYTATIDGSRVGEDSETGSSYTGMGGESTIGTHSAMGAEARFHHRKRSREPDAHHRVATEVDDDASSFFSHR